MPAVRRLLRLGLGKKFKVVRRARTVHVVCPNWCTVPLCPTRLPAASKMHRARATSKWGARAALVATLALVSATPSAPHFTVRFRPEAGSAVLLPDGTTVALAGAPAAVATIASKGTYTGTIVLSPEDALFLSIRSAAALPGTPTCLHGHNVTLPLSRAWTAKFDALVYSSAVRGGTARHRDLRRGSQWGTAVLLPPLSSSPHTGGRLILGASAAQQVSVEAHESLWTLVGWPASTPHEVTPVTWGTRVAFRTPLLSSGGSPDDGHDECGAHALGAAIDAAIPPTDRQVLRLLAAAIDPAAPFTHAVSIPAALVTGSGGLATLPTLLPCASEYKDSASCNGAQSALGSDGSMYCEWAAGECQLVVGRRCAQVTDCISQNVDCFCGECSSGYELIQGGLSCQIKTQDNKLTKDKKLTCGHGGKQSPTPPLLTQPSPSSPFRHCTPTTTTIYSCDRQVLRFEVALTLPPHDSPQGSESKLRPRRPLLQQALKAVSPVLTRTTPIPGLSDSMLSTIGSAAVRAVSSLPSRLVTSIMI